MKKIILLVCFLPLVMGILPAQALTTEQGGDSPTRTLLDDIKKYVDVPKGAVDWKTFGATKEIDIRGTTKEGYDLEYYKPSFTQKIKDLDGKQIIVKGFMFPLEATDNQKNFLMGPFPVSCPFHYHVSPSLVLEVHADKYPVPFSYDPIIVAGTLQLVQKDEVNSTFYRLLNAHLVKEH